MTGATLATVLLIAGLATALVVELRPTSAPEEDVPPTPRAVLVAAAPAAPTGRTDTEQALLARPLFSATRRPPDGPAAAGVMAAAATPLPRMTAILIDGSRRSAIFAPANGKPVVVPEGGRIGAFLVQHIEPQRVTVLGPEGVRTVRTSFDAALQPPPPPAPSAIPLGGGIPLPLPLPGAFPAVQPGLPTLSGAAR